MESSKPSGWLVSTLLLLICHISISSPKPLLLLQSHQDELSALLQFKDSFVVDIQSCFYYDYYHPKVESWNPEIGDYCEWEGVQCDTETNHVISLDLSQNCLFGSINSSSSLFRLVHLQSLNLAYNNFSYSQIPPEIGNLSNLTHLNLSSSAFSGQIPSQLFNLSALVSLDLSSSSDQSLKLQKPNLSDLLEGLTNLKHLHLDSVNISSTIPHLLSQLSSLESLCLNSCDLLGEFPTAIFEFPNLKILNVGYNSDLKVTLPEFQLGNQLKSLTLNSISSNGVIPPSIGNLVYLEEFDISSCNFTGQIPSSIGKLTKLVTLWMDYNKLFGSIPAPLWNLTSLQDVSLSNNQFSGEIPVQINQLTSLQWLDLSSNSLQGSVPTNLSNLQNLESLYLHSNNLSGSVDFNIFFQLKNLFDLNLSLNKLSLLTTVNKSPTNRRKFSFLGLASCNLTEFPSFLRNQHQLLSLDLSSNEINGEIPLWMCNLNTNSLDYLNISHNHLTGFEQDVFLWKKLRTLDLRSNMLQGPLPVPPPSTVLYLISNNSFSGPISLSFCNLTSVKALDLSFNNLSGNLPQCLSTSSGSLSLLDLRRNNFDGVIPSMWREGCKLRMISLSYNQLQGQIPKSLVNCSSLQLIDFSHNQLNDGFPSWIGSLTELQILLLKSNQFHGAINQVESFGFQNLRIIDLSYNNFFGELQSFYFQNWDAMAFINESHRMDYISQSLLPRSFYLGETFGDYHFSMVMYVKGLEYNYSKIPDILTAIDFSNNKFEGEIPEIIGNLKALYFLNLSSNNLQGGIPSSLSNLRKLESLDLSNNKLSGEIPWQLTKISSLSSLDVSFNNLSGRIPQGQQFCTFDDSSFEGNPGLFSDTSGNQCGNYRIKMPTPVSPSSMQDEDSYGSGFEWNWVIILMGCGSGIVVGVVAGNEFVIRKKNWLLKTLGKKKQTSRRKKGRRNRN